MSRKKAFLKSWKFFIPRSKNAKADPNGVHLTVFPFHCGLGKGIETLKRHLVNLSLKYLEDVLSHLSESVPAYPNAVHLTIFQYTVI